MKHILHLFTIILTFILVGCGSGGSATPVDGSYVQADNPEVSLVIKNGRYQRGRASLGVAEGTFAARKIDDATFELDVKYSGQFAGSTDSTQFIRKQGDSIFVKDRADGVEIEFKRK